jgi:hypothetical protein
MGFFDSKNRFSVENPVESVEYKGYRQLPDVEK